MKPEILYKDNSIIVCFKPAGVASQADRSFREDMESFLKKHLMKQNKQQNPKKRQSVEPYVGIVHRLDKPVSGILVYGKTKEATAFLSKQVNAEGNSGFKMQKKYHATVHGNLCSNTYISLSNELVFDKQKNYSYVVESKSPQSKTALLEYRTIKSYSDSQGNPVTDLDIILHTGRHHQIRVQFAHLGHPIVGDNKYGTLEENSKIPLCLCAYSITFLHPVTKEEMTFTLPEAYIPMA